MPSPEGTVAALSSASSTVFSIGIVFLGYWGVHQSTAWTLSDTLVTAFALAGFALLGAVPWMVTTPVEVRHEDRYVRIARRLFLAGVASIWCAVAISVIA
ncbi:hypothetical protein [Paraburkholderia sp.]|uniref:hypothetical protein n=1 Tax=Paraburkholderia sp. TaxID=1926495 RepID=UPI0023994673|nr:hypothetical protein [Paraburkholderia sp.]MDE1180112.1 hypothetical protein [Paraburkholderia sp.]